MTDGRCDFNMPPEVLVYEQHDLRHNLTFDMTVTKILGVGTQILCVTQLLIIFYLSVKFH